MAKRKEINEASLLTNRKMEIHTREKEGIEIHGREWKKEANKNKLSRN